MNYNNLIIALVILLVVMIVGGVFFLFNNNSTPIANNTVVNNTSSSSVNVEQINTEEEVSGSSNGNTHIVMGEDGFYFVVDDVGNILENLGPSKKHYPNGYNGQPSVDYPDAEPYERYLPYGKR